MPFPWISTHGRQPTLEVQILQILNHVHMAANVHQKFKSYKKFELNHVRHDDDDDVRSIPIRG